MIKFGKAINKKVRGQKFRNYKNITLAKCWQELLMILEDYSHSFTNFNYSNDS
jgi:hypothetical protein